MSDLNIYQRLNEVRKLIEYIKKDALVQGYKAVSHDMVTSEVRDHLISQGVIIVPRLMKSAMIDTGTATKSGNAWLRYEAWYEIDFVNMDKPEDKVTMPIESHALDTGDKATGKACSYATKYAILKIFNIESGDDEESRQESKPTVKFKKNEKKEFYAQSIKCMADGDVEGLQEIWGEYDADAKAILWSLFNSQERSAIKELMK